MAPEAVRIAMWSGPRNISTAMMRAWENRADTTVIDEPLYAAYLDRTGLDHPGACEIIESGETDWRLVTQTLLGPVPGNKPIWYQKLMTHHMLPEVGLDWIFGLTNCFLIRSPREVITSYIKVRPVPTQADLGFVQQIDIFDQVRRRTETTPPVLDARDVLENPRRMLGLLCDAVGVPFSQSMLRWPLGRRETDGVWAKYWYAAVERSTTFEPYRPKDDEVPSHLLSLMADCEAIYDEMYRHRLGRST